MFGCSEAVKSINDFIEPGVPLRLVIGAGSSSFDGWVATDRELLDICKTESWESFLGGRRVSRMLSEHVFEHIPQELLGDALSNCFTNLESGGSLRIAVPDGYHSDPEYIEYVKPGGKGAGADDHHHLFNIESLTRYLEDAGFIVKPLEYWNLEGEFQFVTWSEADGIVNRSMLRDPRNVDGKPNYTSLIVDGIKPRDY